MLVTKCILIKLAQAPVINFIKNVNNKEGNLTHKLTMKISGLQERNTELLPRILNTRSLLPCRRLLITLVNTKEIALCIIYRT